MTLITDLAALKKHLAITSCKQIELIMMPLLKKHGIVSFNFYREYPDRRFIRLSTNQSWTEHFFEKQYWNKTDKVPTHYFEKPVNYFLWVREDYPAMLIDSEVNFNISNGISIALCYPHYTESFGFGTTRNNHSIVNRFYLNNLDVLLNYCEFFKEKAKSIIEYSEKDKIVLHKPISCKEEIIKIPKMTDLSQRQFECAQLLIRGMTVKEIARSIGLSSRTVEYYIDNMKLKLQCRNKTDLIIRLLRIITTQQV